MRKLSLVAAVGFTLVAAYAGAADSPPAVVRGTIARIDATSVSITRVDGTTMTALLGATTSFGVVERRHFQQINSTDYVGITSVPGPHDTMTAKEIHIIPWKGAREGSYPWDHAPGGAKAAGNTTNGTVSGVQDDPAAYTMTNASVAAASVGQLKVTYQGAKIVDGKCTGHAAEAVGKPCSGLATVDVPPTTPIVAIVPAKPSDAKVGLTVIAMVVPQPKGEGKAVSLILEKNGVKPVF
ncbi:MAG TPA: hypothetical protein VGP07_20965 [Polyangia bacterium]|jgi:hypothetical protein